MKTKIKYLAKLLIFNSVFFICHYYSFCQNWQTLTDSADYYSKKGEFSNALKFGKFALERASKEFEDLDTNSRKTLNFIGETFYYLGNLDSSAFYFRLGIESDKKATQNISIDRANLYLNLAVVLDDQGKIKESEQLYKECLSMNRILFPQGSPEVANCLNSLAVCLKSQGKLNDAEPIYLEALEMNRRLYKNDDPNLATSMCNVANFYTLQGKLSDAEKLYKESLEMRKRIYKNVHPDLANGLSNLAVFYLNQSKYPEAEQYCKEALEMIQTLFQKDHPSVATMINNLAKIYYNLGKYSLATEYYNKSYQMRQRLFKGDHQDIANDMNNLAMLYKDQGKYGESEKLFLKAIEMYKRIYKKDHQNIANCLDNISSLCLAQGRFNDAEKFSNESMEMTSRLFPGDNPATAVRMNNHAMINESIGNFKEAESFYIKSIDMNKRLFNSDNQLLLQNYINLGNLYYNQNNYKSAESLYELAYEIGKNIYRDDHPNIANCLNNLAKIQIKLKNYILAEKYFISSLEMQNRLYNSNHPSIAETMMELAKLYEIQNKYELAENSYLKSLNMYRDFYINNSSNLSEKEKEQFWSTIKNHFEFFYSFVNKRLDKNPLIVEDLFDYLLFSKGLLLSSVLKMKERIQNSSDLELKDKFKEWQSLKEYLAFLYKFTFSELKDRNINRDSIEVYTNSLEKELASSSQLFSSKLDKTIYHWNDIKSRLKDDETLIELIRFHNSENGKLTNQISYFCLLLNGGSSSQPKLILLKNGNYLDSAGYLIYKEINHNNFESVLSKDIRKYNKNYESLFSKYWKPIQKMIPSGNKIYFSPDGVYNQINILTLINPNSKKYLLDEINLNQITSSKEIHSDRQNFSVLCSNKDLNGLLIGFPNYTLKDTLGTSINTRSTFGFKSLSKKSKERGYNFELLPGTKIEVESINNILKECGIKTKLLIENEATESSLKKIDNPTFLHIATHGFFITQNENLDLKTSENFNILKTDLQKSQENPLLRSGLLLAGASSSLSDENLRSETENDGILTAFEAQNLNLDKTELVVLSACETGKGELHNGEGVYGLQRAFQVAGAKNLIMSLWKVDDEATQLMMTSFYKNWVQSGNLSDSFRKAQQFIKDKYKKPYYWGAFVLVSKN